MIGRIPKLYPKCFGLAEQIGADERGGLVEEVGSWGESEGWEEGKRI